MGPDLVGNLALERRIVGVPGGGVVVAEVSPGVECRAVEELAGSDGRVTGVLKVSRYGTDILEYLLNSPVGLVPIDARARG